MVRNYICGKTCADDSHEITYLSTYFEHIQMCNLYEEVYVLAQIKKQKWLQFRKQN